MAVLLIQPWIDAQDPQPGAVVDGRELVVLLRLRPLDRCHELDVDLNLVTRELLLVALPTFVETLVALRCREPAQVEALEDSPHPRLGNRDVVIALEVHGDLARPEVVVLAQIEDLADHLGLGGVRAHLGPFRTRPETFFAELLVALLPVVEGLAGNPVIPAGHRDVPGHFLGMVEDRQAPFHLAFDL